MSTFPTYGFSTLVMNHPNCIDYFTDGGYGYIHHSQRCKETDEYLERRCKELNIPLEYLCTWLTSTDGRHFCDNFYNLTLQEKLKLCESHLIEIHNLGMIFLHPEHKGTYNSTCELREKLKNKLWTTK